VNEQARKRNGSDETIRPPAYPWTARQLFGELRGALSQALGEPMKFRRLGEIMGKPKSTAYHWFERHGHPEVLGFFCCLERLNFPDRHDFIDRHCRIFPTLDHAWLAHAPTRVHKLHGLLQKPRGLTIVTGGTEFSRSFLVRALGHSNRNSSAKGNRLTGLDLIRPTRFVPLESCSYIDGCARLDKVRAAVMKVWPKILTHSATLVVLNGVWAIPELREDILKLAARAHVLLATAEPPDLAILHRMAVAPVHFVSLSESKSIEGAIRVDCRQIRPLKRP